MFNLKKECRLPETKAPAVPAAISVSDAPSCHFFIPCVIRYVTEFWTALVIREKPATTKAPA